MKKQQSFVIELVNCFYKLTSVVCFLIFTGCATLVTQSFVDEYATRVRSDDKRSTVPAYRDFHGWSVSVQCRSAFESNDKNTINSNEYSISIWPHYVGDTTEHSPQIDSLDISEVEVTMYPAGDRVVLKNSHRTPDYISEIGMRFIGFGSVNIPRNVDSLLVRYHVQFEDYITNFTDRTEFEYILHRTEERRKVNTQNW